MTTARFAVENYTAPFSLSFSQKTNKLKDKTKQNKWQMHKAWKTTQQHSFNVLSSSKLSPVEKSFSDTKVVISILTEEVLRIKKKQKQKKKRSHMPKIAQSTNTGVINNT